MTSDAVFDQHERVHELERREHSDECRAEHDRLRAEIAELRARLDVSEHDHPGEDFEEIPIEEV